MVLFALRQISTGHFQTKRVHAFLPFGRTTKFHSQINHINSSIAALGLKPRSDYEIVKFEVTETGVV